MLESSGARLLLVMALLGGCARYDNPDGGPGQSCWPSGFCSNGKFCNEEGACVPGEVLAQATFDLSPADILFVVDNSGGMGRKQLAFGRFISENLEFFKCGFGQDPRVAVVTTGVASPDCQQCTQSNPNSCLNSSGESGRFQDFIGHYQESNGGLEYTTSTDPRCPAVLDESNLDCLFDAKTESGLLLTGEYGCGYERGLEAMRRALESEQGSFLRDEANLVVIILSDEEDCGRIGEITEGLTGIMGDACYFAAHGADFQGNLNDQNGMPYRLTPVEDYYNFLFSLKGNRSGKVRFLIMVGVSDPAHPETTTIFPDANMHVAPTCEIPGCVEECPTGDDVCRRSCRALPGTRYIRLAQLFGGANIASICELESLGVIVNFGCSEDCPKLLPLSKAPGEPENLRIYVNEELLPRYSCAVTTGDLLNACTGPQDSSCPQGAECLPTWSYLPPSQPPDPDTPGGFFVLGDHFDLCKLSGYGYVQDWQVVMLVE